MFDEGRTISSTGIPSGDEHPPWKHQGKTYGPANPTTYDKDQQMHEETLEGGGLWDPDKAGEARPVVSSDRDENGLAPLGQRIRERVLREQGYSPRHEETKANLTKLKLQAEAVGLDLQRILTHEQWVTLTIALGASSLNKTASQCGGDKANVRKALKAATKAIERAVRGRR